MNKQAKSKGCNQCIDDEQLEADLIAAEPCLAMALQDVAEDGRSNGHQRYPSVVDRLLAGHAEDEHAEDGAVRVGGKAIDGVDGTVVVQLIEDDDDNHHEQRHDVMYQLACQGQVFVVLFLVCLQDVDGERGSECRQGGAGGRIGRSYQPDDEDDANKERKVFAPCHFTEQGVACYRAFLAQVGVGIHVEQRTQYEKQADDEDLDERTQNHVLLRLTEVLAAQGALHQVLVEACAGDNHEYAGDELLPEVAAVIWVVEEEQFAGGVTGHGRRKLAETNLQVIGDDHDATDDRHDETEGFQRVCPNQGLHAALERIEPDERHRQHHVEGEWHAQGSEHQRLQHDAHYKGADRSPQHLGYEEEPRPCTVGGQSETTFK